MARRVDEPRKLTAPARRPPLEREFSAGGLVYRRRAGACEVVLAGRRHAQTGNMVWTIPKGHLEAGESSADAAVREVREETGIVAEVDGPLGDVTYWFARRDERGQPVRVFKRVRFFLMRATGGRFADRDAEMDAVRWYPLDEAERTVSFANERALLARAAALLAAAG
ncbi:MAG TPA: NUDIX hydrolase [Candidatus Binatia bacterium]|nr:NUDIX hydrolase [Candidatus Binatia bacterium]